MPIDDIGRRIDVEYRDGGYGLGWRLLASPISCLDMCEIAFVGLNPGGRVIESEHASLAMDTDSAYVVERWSGHPPGQSPLQRQVRLLFRGLGVSPARVLAGNLVPFRSPDWAALPNKERALTFGCAIWEELLDRARPGLIVTMGGMVFDRLADQLDLARLQKVASGWGRVHIRYGDSGGVRLVGLPHLSRFALLGRPASEAPFRQAFGRYWKGA